MHANAPIDLRAAPYRHVIEKLGTITRNFDPAAPDMLRSAVNQVLGEDLGVCYMQGYLIVNTYDGLSAKDADDLMQGIIDGLVFEALDEARRMKVKGLHERDIFEWSRYVSGLIAVVVENRRSANRDEIQSCLGSKAHS